MMNAIVLPFIACLSFMLLTEDQVHQNRTYNPIEWQLAARLPDANGVVSTGFAGAINEVNGNVLIVAGGSNFPDKLPWEGGRKHYSDAIHILYRNGNAFEWDKNTALKLPEPVAYCGNTSTPAGIVYAGGENDKGLLDKAYLLKWGTGNNKIVVKRLPNLPMAVTNIALTSINNMVYAVGGDGAVNSVSLFCCIDLNNAPAGWQMLPALPLQLANTVTIVQHGPKGNYIYVIGGRSKMPSGISTLHGNVFRYNILKHAWESCAGVSDGKNAINFSAGTGVAFGKHSILIMGGDNGVVFHQIETYLAKIKQAVSPVEKERLTKEKNELNMNHKGFYKGVLLYNTLENTWTKAGELPFLAHVTTTATKWGDDVVISNGEIKPGIRTPDVMLGKILITEK